MCYICSLFKLGQDEEERARIKHPDLSPQELALNPRVGEHLPKQRVDCGRDELILEGSRLRIREGDLSEEVIGSSHPRQLRPQQDNDPRKTSRQRGMAQD